MRRNPAVFAILVGGGIAGLLDITYAVVYSGWFGTPAQRILQSVASGLLGKAAFDGGMVTAALGLVLHFLMMLLIAAVYYAASTRLGLLTRKAVPMGLLYGVCVFLVMRLVVLPLSAYPFPVHLHPLSPLIPEVIAQSCVGLIIALAARSARRSS
jgi:uncharacterized membrane protein YagU involved in acid resistance